MSRGVRTLVTAVAALAALGVVGVPGPALSVSASGLSAPSAAPAAARPAPIPDATTRLVIGHSVRGRPIVALHLSSGQPASAPRVLLMARMHGNEPAPGRILQTLANGPEVGGIDLWVVPTDNPDGLAAGSRHNAHGVDLNRNFPHDWAPLTGNYYSGPKAASEPETRAMMGFLRRLRPDRILSFHQPLDGVDTDTKDPAFARRVAHALRLPTTSLDCGGTCHGTLTGWYNAGFPGTALTVEYPAHPSAHRMTVEAPRRLLRLFGARLAQPHAETW